MVLNDNAAQIEATARRGPLWQVGQPESTRRAHRRRDVARSAAQGTTRHTATVAAASSPPGRPTVRLVRLTDGRRNEPAGAEGLLPLPLPRDRRLH